VADCVVLYQVNCVGLAGGHWHWERVKGEGFLML